MMQYTGDRGSNSYLFIYKVCTTVSMKNTTRRHNLSFPLVSHHFNNAHKEGCLPNEVKRCFVAEHNPLLTQRVNPTVSFVDVIVWLGRKHRCDKEADSNTRG